MTNHFLICQRHFCRVSAGWLAAAGLVLLVGAGCEKPGAPPPVEPPIDVQALESKAQVGDAQAQQTLGQAYAYGRGATQDFTAAVKWLTAAAKQGHAAAQHDLAQLYEAGQGVKQSYTNALVWFRKAAEQGHPEAQYSLAVLYAFGRGVPMNDTEAARWYQKAAEGGEALAQFNIGQRYQAGRGVPVDLVEAYKWLSLAAEEIPDAVSPRDQVRKGLTREQLSEAKRWLEQFTVAQKGQRAK